MKAGEFQDDVVLARQAARLQWRSQILGDTARASNRQDAQTPLAVQPHFDMTTAFGHRDLGDDGTHTPGSATKMHTAVNRLATILQVFQSRIERDRTRDRVGVSRLDPVSEVRGDRVIPDAPPRVPATDRRATGRPVGQARAGHLTALLARASVDELRETAAEAGGEAVFEDL